MFLRTSTLLMMLWAGGALAQGQDCNGPGYQNAMMQIESYYESHTIALFNTQLQINAVAGHTALQPDGAWGPNTAGHVCRSLQTYAAINGYEPDSLIQSVAEAGEFVQWMGAAARATLNPGMLEFPD